MTLTVSYCSFHGFAHADKSQAVIESARNILLNQKKYIYVNNFSDPNDTRKKKFFVGDDEYFVRNELIS